MRLLAVGLSHRTAPVELRERVDFARAGVETALNAIAVRGIAREAVVLSTCNRAEIYAGVDVVNGTADPALAIAQFFGEYHGVPHAVLADHLYVHRGADAARHLFRVSAGLDSLVNRRFSGRSRPRIPLRATDSSRAP
jgi:glutamyl-tRNA reductase